MTKRLGCLIFLVVFCGSVFAQAPEDNPRDPAALRLSLERIFYSKPYATLQEGILEMSRRHSIYSYVIANFSTPDFDLLALLPYDDQERLARIMPTNEKVDDRVVMEFVLSRFSENSRRYNAVITMWGGKKQSLNKIITMGK